MPEISIYVDNDDPESAEMARSLGMVVTIGPRIVMTEMWNVAYRASKGDILMQCGDDIVFRTKNWDVRVSGEFESCKDKILFVYGDDLHQGGNLGTHGFLHRTWVEQVGYFLPPIFSADYGDMWLHYVSGELGRRVFLSDVITEHMHVDAGKAEWDQTYRDNRARYDSDRVWEVWEKSLPERQRDVQALSKYIADNR